MTSVGSPRTYGRSRPQLVPKKMQRKPRKAKSLSSVPCISLCSCQEEPHQGPTMVAEEDDLMKEEETIRIVADQMSIEEMDMIDAIEVSFVKIRFNTCPLHHSRYSQLQETFTNDGGIHRPQISLCEMGVFESFTRAMALGVQAYASIILSSDWWRSLKGGELQGIFSIAVQLNNIIHLVT